MNSRYDRMTCTLLCACFLLAGCQPLRTPYQRPETQIPTHWPHGSDASALNQADSAWWQSFQDPLLNQLIEDVLKRNNDLAMAGLKLYKAQLQAGLVRHEQAPQLSASVNSSLSRSLDQNSATSQIQATTASVSYELDLWGKLASQRDAAEWEAQATAEDKAATALSLIGTTATLYWQIAWLNERLALSEASLADTRRILTLTQQKYAAGAVGALDLYQAEQEVASQEAALYTQQQARVEKRNALAILFDAPPGAHQPERTKVSDLTLPTIQPDLPASLLARRPDLKASEWRLRESLAQVDNSRLSLYPDLTLTSSVGTSSSALKDLLHNPVGTLGAGLSLPFVNWPTVQLNVDIANTSYQTAVVQFRQDLYQAFSDVDNDLAAQAHYQAQYQALLRASALADHSRQLAEQKYRAGATNVKTWLDQQIAWRTAESSRIENYLNQLLTRVQLYQALGG